MSYAQWRALEKLKKCSECNRPHTLMWLHQLTVEEKKQVKPSMDRTGLHPEEYVGNFTKIINGILHTVEVVEATEIKKKTILEKAYLCPGCLEFLIELGNGEFLCPSCQHTFEGREEELPEPYKTVEDMEEWEAIYTYEDMESEEDNY